MNGLVMLLIAAVVLGAGYLLYGRWLANKWGIDPKKPTPAVELEDGIDYCPTKASVVFGHEFSSIAGAGPINGPIQAAFFGWVPVLLWILVGGVFFGAAHDFATLYASVKNKGKTIGYIVESYIGKTGKRLFLVFMWLLCVLVVAAFADIVAGTFGATDPSNPAHVANGSVATTSMVFIFAAVGLGFLIRYALKGNQILMAVVAVAILAASIAIGLTAPIFVPKSTWLSLVFAYIFVASITPVWALLQPRDYMNSFLLVMMILAAFIGVLVAAPVIQIPAFVGFHVNGQYMFPILFVTVACGAISGFHCLVASGTAAKQIENEKHMLPIGFGSMLIESFLAVISLITIGVGVATAEGLSTNGVIPKGMTPPQIFAGAVAGFLSKMGLPSQLSFTLITLAISAFALTSLDTCARIGRMALQELFTEDWAPGQEVPALNRVLTNKYVATVLTLVLGYLLAVMGYQKIWPLFGSANQLLAALALVACAVFLKKTNRQGVTLWAPMGIMLIVTFTALVMSIRSKFALLSAGKFNPSVDGLQLVIGILLLALGIMCAIQGIGKLREKDTVSTPQAQAKAS